MSGCLASATRRAAASMSWGDGGGIAGICAAGSGTTVPVAELAPWHYADPFFQQAPASEVDLDPYYEGQNLETLTERYFSAIGFEIGDLLIQPFPVPHDAREPVQFLLSDGSRRLGVLTDLGCSTPHVEQILDGCQALVLECNHDADMLRDGNYPRHLKQRIASRLGHLDNTAAAALLAALDHHPLQHVVAAHLSQQNNTPQLARQALAAVLGCAEEWIGVADQESGFGWRAIL